MHTHIQILRQKMRYKDIDAVFISSSDSIGYYTQLFHFSPIEREACMLITLNNTYLFTDSRFSGIAYPEKIKRIQTSARQGVYSSLKTILEAEKIQKFGYEAENLTIKEFRLLKKTTRNKATLVDCTTLLSFIRSQKTQSEIAMIKKACKITDTAFRFILTKISLGVTEKQIAEEIDNFFKENYASAAFPSIVAFGNNASIPHHHPTNKKLTKNDVYILFDIGARYHNYCSDLSRTVFFGAVPHEIQAQYTIVKQAQEQALHALTLKKRTAKSIDHYARTYVEQNGHTIPHAVGHSLGIQVHENPTLSPVNNSPIQKNMTLAIEPGIYIPQKGGIRIEDTVLITKTGYTVLTKSTKEIIVINNQS